MTDADLVLEGGGVKGIGLVGALSLLKEHDDPYDFHRVAGTSAGAIVASLLAAGYSIPELQKVMTDLDFSQFEDTSGLLHRLPFKPLHRFSEACGLVFHEGLFKGEFLHSWITEKLAAKNVHTWGDLKEIDPDSSLPPEQRYKLVVIVSDISRGRMLKLPWNYTDQLAVDADRQPVADAVRSSAGIPFFFRPFHMKADPARTAGHGEVLCTDGGMLSNYPVDIFDRNDGREPRWPTLGVKLSAKRPIDEAGWTPNTRPLALAKSLISTMQNAHDRAHVDDPAFASRTIFVDTTGYKATDFHLTPADKDKLFANGRNAATGFLAKWDWERWKRGDYTTLL
jgi:NTE family protein